MQGCQAAVVERVVPEASWPQHEHARAHARGRVRQGVLRVLIEGDCANAILHLRTVVVFLTLLLRQREHLHGCSMLLVNQTDSRLVFNNRLTVEALLEVTLISLHRQERQRWHRHGAADMRHAML
jgi:hypothetical protein